MATLEDIARELGISKSTVSKALNGAKDVSKAMRQTVLEKAVELGYTRYTRSTAAPRVAVFVINMQYSKPEDFGYDISVIKLAYERTIDNIGNGLIYTLDLVTKDDGIAFVGVCLEVV